MKYLNEDEQYDMKLGLGLAFIIISMVLLMTAFSSCSSIKDVQKTTTDSTTTSKQDSGGVKKNTSTNTDELEWYRNTLMLFAGRRDTNVNNINLPPDVYTPSTPAQPSVIYIQEGGKQRKENTTTNYDSIWKARLDSLTIQKDEKTKQSESTFFGPATILAIFGGVALVVILILLWMQYNINRNTKVVTALLKNIIPSTPSS